MPPRRHDPSHEAPYAAPAVDKALDVLEFLVEQARPFGINELARELGMPVNSAYRILMRLAGRGYVARAPGKNGYQLSSKLFSLGMQLQDRFELRSRAGPHLEKLCRRARETCQLHVLDGTDMLVVDCLHPASDYWVQVRLGARLLCHCNAFGKAVLAFLAKGEQDALLSKLLPALTPHTVTSRAALQKEFAAIVKTGLAYDREEYVIGTICVGACVFNAGGRAVAGLGVTSFASNMKPKRYADLGGLVLETAAAVSRDIGYAGERYKTWLRLAAQKGRD